jgi:hypothetical protein
MTSTDMLQQLEDRQVVRTGNILGLNLLLAEYRRAVAAEEFYDHLTCAMGATFPPKVPRSQIARTVFDRFYSSETVQLHGVRARAGAEG